MSGGAVRAPCPRAVRHRLPSTAAWERSWVFPRVGASAGQAASARGHAIVSCSPVPVTAFGRLAGCSDPSRLWESGLPWTSLSLNFKVVTSGKNLQSFDLTSCTAWVHRTALSQWSCWASGAAENNLSPTPESSGNSLYSCKGVEPWAEMTCHRFLQVLAPLGKKIWPLEMQSLNHSYFQASTELSQALCKIQAAAGILRASPLSPFITSESASPRHLRWEGALKSCWFVRQSVRLPIILRL